MEDADATRSLAPALVTDAATLSLEPGETFEDEPERYQIEGRIGSGGMGTVLAARGSRLGRKVALKVVTVDRDELRRRFEREAHITARLQHPAIVPVYGAGRRAGHPFYAMKQVSGDPLDAAIARADSRTARMALLPNVIAVTEAIAYAHAEGVIHRDLKPANVLVGKFGETVVIDWGLAKDVAHADDEPAESVSPYRDADATAIGKVMGTPAYMPLEQARGERVDARADVYALGAILYHVLAGTAPYKRAGEGSVPWESMLARVLAGPPASLPDDVPRDLAAIVDRAMARDATARYASAGELADDLRRFQTGQLVGAHRYTSWQLVKRWLRRHRTAVAVAAIAIVLLVAGGVVSLRSIFAEQERTEAQREAALHSRRDAEELTSFMLGDLTPKLEAVGKLDLLDAVANKAQMYYEGRGDEELTAGEQLTRAQAISKLGSVLFARGKLEAALAEYRKSLAMRQELVDHALYAPPFLFDLGVAHDGISNVLMQQGKSDAALAEIRLELAVYERLAVLEPTPRNRSAVALVHGRIGLVLQQQNKYEDALAEDLQTLAIAESVVKVSDSDGTRRQLVVGHNRVGGVLYHLGRSSEALEHHQRAVDIARARVLAAPTDVGRTRDLAVTLSDLADTQATRADLDGALATRRASLALAQQVADRDPTNTGAQSDVATGLDEVSKLLFQRGELAGAFTLLQEALVIDERLVVQEATNAERKSRLADRQISIGNVQLSQSHPRDALVSYRKALAIRDALATAEPSNARWQRARMGASRRVGDALRNTGDLPGAIAAYRQQLAIADKLAAASPDDGGMIQSLAIAYESLGEGLTEAGDLREAVAQLRTSRDLCERLATTDPHDSSYAGNLIEVRQHLGLALIASNDLDAALVELRAALASATTMAAAGPADVASKLRMGAANNAIGDVLAKRGDRQGAADAYHAGLDAITTTAQVPEIVELRDKLAAKLR